MLKQNLSKNLFTYICPRRTLSSYQEKVFLSQVDVSQNPVTKISVLNLNDNQTRNALSKDIVSNMANIIDELKSCRDTRVLILRSLVPKIFCAGANLKERVNMSKSQVESWLRIQRAFIDSLSNFPFPTIAAIDGYALGGGLELGLACDIRIVNESAKVGLVETKLAIIPGAGGTQRLSRLIGVAKAKELIFTGDIINGRTAFEIGVANHCADGGDDASYHMALEIGRKICDKGPIALRLAKAAIDVGYQTSLSVGLDIEHAYYGQLLDSADRIEGMKAFIDKRPPVYKGE